MALSRGAVIDILFSLSVVLFRFVVAVGVRLPNPLLVVLANLLAANSRPLLDNMSCTLLLVMANWSSSYIIADGKMSSILYGIVAQSL